MQSKEARIKFLRRRDNELGRRINIHKRDLKGDLHELTRSSIQQSLRGDQDERASVKCEIASLEKKAPQKKKKNVKKTFNCGVVVSRAGKKKSKISATIRGKTKTVTIKQDTGGCYFEGIMIITERGKTIRPGKVYLSNYKNKQKKVKVAHLRTAMEDNGSIRKNHLAVAWTTDLEKYLNILGRLTD